MPTPKFMALAALLLLGCSPGVLGEAVAPKATTAAEAIGDDELALTCRGVPEYGAPLIVDWSAQQRLDLEYRMNQAVAVVAYTCERFEVLDRCSVAGNYRFAGVSRKEDVVKLESRDELGVNLPLSGASLAASLERGSSIDLGLVLIGKKATTVRAVARPMLVGHCEGATHFVQAATVGAFAMDRGTVGKTRAAAEIFSASASGSSNHESQQQSRDGDLQACRKATPEAEAAPGQCQAALRLDLVPIVAELPPQAERPAPAKTAPPLDDRNRCPEGMVRQGQKCAPPGPREGLLACAEGILTDCERTCRAGDMPGCVRLADAYANGDGLPRDVARAISLYDRACSEDDLMACTKSGRLKATCRKRQAEEPRACLDPIDFRGAAKDLAKACDSGLGAACIDLGFGADEVREFDGRPAHHFLERGCDLGVGVGCFLASFMYLKGEGGVAKDSERGTELVRASCDGGDDFSCTMLDGILAGDEDMGTERKPRELLELRRRRCRQGHKHACHLAGELLVRGKDGIQRNPTEALRHFERACALPGPHPDSCLRMGRHHRRRDLSSAEALRYFTLACNVNGSGCMDAAAIARAQTLPKLHAQCTKGDGQACDALAAALVARGCSRKGGAACVRLEKRDPELAMKGLRRQCLFFEKRDPSKLNCKLYLERGGSIEPGK